MSQLFTDYFAAHREFLIPATLVFAILMVVWVYVLIFLWLIKDYMDMRMKYCDWRDERKARKARALAQSRPWE